MTDKILNKVELIAKIAADSNQSQNVVSGVLDALFNVLAESVANDIKVTIPGWLSVERKPRAARTGLNPQTRETIQIPAGYSVRISAGSKLKAASK